MFAIRCPNCKELLKTRGSVLHVKVRCRYCNAVFVGSSELFPDDPETPRGEELTDPLLQGVSLRPGAPRQRKLTTADHGSPPWGVFVTIFAIVVMILVIVGIWFYSTHPKVEVRDRAGRVISRTRRSLDDLETTRNPIDRPDPPTVAPRQHPSPTDGPRGAPGESKEDKDTRITEIGVVDGGTPTSGYVVGVVHNHSGTPITRLKVQCTIVNHEDRQLPLQEVELRYLPPGGSLRFSRGYSGISRKDIRDLRCTAADILTDKHVMCWTMDSALARRTLSDKTIIVEGSLRNGAAETAWEVKVYCDFFTDENVHVGTSVGELAGRSYLRPKQTGEFQVSFDTTGSGFFPELITGYSLRAVGRR